MLARGAVEFPAEFPVSFSIVITFDFDVIFLTVKEIIVKTIMTRNPCFSICKYFAILMSFYLRISFFYENSLALTFQSGGLFCYHGGDMNIEYVRWGAVGVKESNW